MKFNDLRKHLLKYPVFTARDVLKWFPKANGNTLKVELNQWIKRGYLKKIRRALFCLAEAEIEDNFYLAEKILTSSYVSLESALNYYSIIPDIPQIITCLTSSTTRKFKTHFGSFSYRHIKKDYFFGFQTVYSQDKNFFYNIALPEKALLDFIYFNAKRLKDLKNFQEERFCFDKSFSWTQFLKMSKIFKDKKIYQIAKKIKKEYLPR